MRGIARAAVLLACVFGMLAPDAALAAGDGAFVLGSNALVFGAFAVGSAADAQVVSVHNTGTGPLQIFTFRLTGPDAADFGQSSDCPVAPDVLVAGGACSLYVSFHPHSIGLEQATFVITDDAPDSPQSVALSGTGVSADAPPPPPPPVSGPPGVYLSDGFEGGLSSSWVRQTSTGSSVSVVSSPVNSGSGAVALTNDVDGTSVNVHADLAGGGQAQSYTRFCFRLSGFSQSVEIANGRAITAQYPLGIRRWLVFYNPQAHGLEAYFFNENLQRLDMVAAGGLVTPDAWHCAEVFMDERAAGRAELWLDGASVGSVTGDLSTPDPYSRLYLWNNGAAGTAYVDDVAVTATPNGTAAGPPPPPPVAGLTVDTPALSLGSRAVGVMGDPQTVTVTNAGSGPAELSPPRLTGPSDFAVASTTCPTAPAVLGGGSSCAVSVTFTPTAVGPRSGGLAISTTGSTAHVALSGTGTYASGVLLADTFDTGLSAWNRIGPGTVVDETAVVHAGTGALELTNATNAEYGGVTAPLVGSGQATSTAFCFNVTGVAAATVLAQGRDSQGRNLWEIDYDGPRHGLDVYLWNEQRARTDLYTPTGLLTEGQWACAELRLDERSAGSAELLLDGASVASVAADLAATDAYSRLYLWNNGSAGTVRVDDVLVGAR